MKPALIALIAAIGLVTAAPAPASEGVAAKRAAPAAGTPLTVELSAQASQAARNDLASAVLYSERSGADAAALAAEVNRDVTAALEIARAEKSIEARTGNVSTWPIYDKDERGRITAWRMRSEIRLESSDLPAMSALLGKLQTKLALAQVAITPAPATRRAALDGATVNALHAFEARAQLIADTLRKQYRIVHLSVGDSGFAPPPMPRMRMATMAAEAAPAPLEGGESEVSVHVSGRIELLD